MKFHEHPQLPQGFTCYGTNCGLKPEARDLSLFCSDTPAAAAAVFTRNLCPGAPVIVGRELIKGGVLQAVVVNSKISNVGMGAAGIHVAREMGEIVASELSISQEHVLMSSTGLILHPLPIDKVRDGLAGVKAKLGTDPLPAAEGIMTTDTHPKVFSLSVGPATITIFGKGAGMIAPNMATMLIYIFTDAAVEASHLDASLRRAVDASFNMLSIDTDTSTSDTCAILANGQAGELPPTEFDEALQAACIRMAELIARDGEGATKLLRVTITGAHSREDARTIARTVVDSPLIKTMAHGADPNIGRVLMAIGKCVDCDIALPEVQIRVNEELLYEREEKVAFNEARVRKLLSGDPVDLTVRVNDGVESATAFGCPLTEGYVQENAAYYSS